RRGGRQDAGGRSGQPVLVQPGRVVHDRLVGDLGALGHLLLRLQVPLGRVHGLGRRGAARAAGPGGPGRGAAGRAAARRGAAGARVATAAGTSAATGTAGAAAADRAGRAEQAEAVAAHVDRDDDRDEDLVAVADPEGVTGGLAAAQVRPDRARGRPATAAARGRAA